MKHERCWARKLDDCSDKLSREHLISNAAWPGEDRSSRDRYRITSQAGIYRAGRIDTNVPGGHLRQQTVAGLTKKVLCTRHNSSLSECDDAAGELTRVLDQFWGACVRRPYDTLSYTEKIFTVDGLRLQRWFLKTAITFAVGDGEPIGGPEAEASAPMDDLVDIAFGRSHAHGHVGLWTIDVPPQDLEQLNGFSMGLWRRVFDDNSSLPFIAGAFVQFRGLWFAVNFDPHNPPPRPQLPRRDHGRSAQYIRFGEVSMPSRSLRLRFT